MRGTARLRALLLEPRAVLLIAAVILEAVALFLWPALYLGSAGPEPTGIEAMFVQRYPFATPVVFAVKPVVDFLFPGALWSWEQIIAFFFHCLVAAYVAYSLAAWRLTRGDVAPVQGLEGDVTPKRRIGLRWIVLPLVVFQITLIFVPSTMTTDIYNYALYGEMPVLYQANPYIHTPQEFPQSPLYYIIPVYWHDAPSVYGPLWVTLSAGIASIFRAQALADELLAYRVIANVAHLANTWLVWRIAGRLRPEGAPSAALAYAWNPSLLIEFALNGHNDVAMLTLTLAAVLLSTQRKYSMSSIALGLSVALKYTSLLIAPLLLLWSARGLPVSDREAHQAATARQDSPPPDPRLGRVRRWIFQAVATMRSIGYGRLVIRGLALVAVVVGLYLPWIEGIDTFGPVLYWMSGPRNNNFWPETILSSITTWLYLRNGTDWTETWNAVLETFKLIAKVGLVLLVLVEAFRAQTIERVLAGSARIFVFFLMLVNTWVLPWYFAWPLTLSAALGWSDRLVRVCAGLTLTASVVMYQRQWKIPVIDERGGIFLALPIILALTPCAYGVARGAVRRLRPSATPTVGAQQRQPGSVSST